MIVSKPQFGSDLPALSNIKYNLHKPRTSMVGVGHRRVCPEHRSDGRACGSSPWSSRSHEGEPAAYQERRASGPGTDFLLAGNTDPDRVLITVRAGVDLVAHQR